MGCIGFASDAHEIWGGRRMLPPLTWQKTRSQRATAAEMIPVDGMHFFHSGCEHSGRRWINVGGAGAWDRICAAALGCFGGFVGGLLAVKALGLEDRPGSGVIEALRRPAHGIGQHLGAQGCRRCLILQGGADTVVSGCGGRTRCRGCTQAHRVGGRRGALEVFPFEGHWFFLPARGRGLLMSLPHFWMQYL